MDAGTDTPIVTATVTHKVTRTEFRYTVGTYRATITAVLTEGTDLGPVRPGFFLQGHVYAEQAYGLVGRVRSALDAQGFEIPTDANITVNVQLMEGGMCNENDGLAIAIGVLIVTGQIDQDRLIPRFVEHHDKHLYLPSFALHDDGTIARTTTGSDAAPPSGFPPAELSALYG